MSLDFDVHEDKSPLSRAENTYIPPLVLGLTQKAMAETLHKSIKTVETHLGHIYQKLDVSNEKQAITALFLRGIVSAKKLMVCCLIVSGASNALVVDSAYAAELSTSPNPHEVPDKRLFGSRHNLRSRLSRSGRRWNRKQEKLWSDCFGDF